ncbi:Uncharacterised protein [Anaerotruncus sp. 2789STDY5834896]|uniref:Uncharacterized protein n=1 Tax=uncultured Anaerotruncus sp. TaxID=905011 RepID=A0A1C6I9C1_9FIRM|nr:Uncharacterised protein [uncultured Anaerotruncus sp.]
MAQGCKSDISQANKEKQANRILLKIAKAKDVKKVQTQILKYLLVLSKDKV